MNPAVRRRVPALVAAPAIAGLVVFVALPVAGLAARVEWSTLAAEIAAPEVRDALRLSAISSLAAAAICVVAGVPLGWMLARIPFRGSSLVRALVAAPMVLPPVVAGVALLAAFGRRGLVGSWLDATFGIRLPFTLGATILAEAFVALPFLVLAVEGAIRGADPRYEEAAATLGASPSRTFRRVTLPMIAPSLAAGATLAWARALGEFGATITFAGNLRGRTQTIPLAVFEALESRPAGALALSVLLMAFSIGVLVLVGRRLLPTLLDGARR